MYEQFYGLTAKPFSLLPDADFLFLSKRHRRVVNLLEYGVMSEAGFVVISGEVGAGKTTTIRHFLKKAGTGATIGLITNPSPALGSLMKWVALAFDLKARDGDATTLYDNFVAFLLDQYGRGKRACLIIDEAQNLTPDMLEELRMLSNVNNERDLLLQIVLVGQPELLGTLNRPDLRQFVQRVAVHCHLTPLDAGETTAYIRHRLVKAGGRADLFDNMACAAAHRFSGGVPRLINLLCDQALVYGYAEETPRITFATIAEVAHERSRSGLNAFVNVPDILSLPVLKAELEAEMANIVVAREAS
ncbi:MAG: AAA family ATPase [Alphaproteobacteria bacterium]|nr:AAA family ATPase [Alphaproteobacteria bacterium]